MFRKLFVRNVPEMLLISLFHPLLHKCLKIKLAPGTPGISPTTKVLSFFKVGLIIAVKTDNLNNNIVYSVNNYIVSSYH